MKDEGKRALGNFKSLGGLSAGLKALARAAGAASVEELLAQPRSNLPPLICASAGNHGLAVAAAARLAGTRAHVYLHAQVPAARAERILGVGADIIPVSGTFDDAVDAAVQAAQRGEGLLIADTSSRADDMVVNEVIDGYRTIAVEVVKQLDRRGGQPPSHLFVQAGVGGLAAALATGLNGHLTAATWLIVVEPSAAPCVATALSAGQPVHVPGSLTSKAVMLACGEASAPAVAILKKHDAVAIAIDEKQLAEAERTMSELGGPATTATGAAGLAGLLAASPGSDLAKQLGIDAHSSVLLIATESAD